MRAILIALLCICASISFAQDIPRVSVEIAEGEITVGQPVVVRIKVLVPTFSPSPPEFPSMEVPGLVVRLPERASGPISERVEGETWSGVQRTYRIYPLRPGPFEIPAQTIRVTYAETGGIEPVVTELDTDVIAFEVAVPPGAADLNPLIVASDFKLTQTLEVPEEIAVGEAIERVIEARISGTTPILIPQLMTALETDVLRAYPKEPAVTESEDRGILSGSRTDVATYLAVAPGEVSLPPINFEWFNLETGEIEKAGAPGATLVITGSAAELAPEKMDRQRLIILGFGIALIVVAFWTIWPSGKRVARSIRSRWVSSEVYASRRVVEAIHRRDLAEVYDTLQRWSAHFPDQPEGGLDTNLAVVGGIRFGSHPSNTSSDAWQKLDTAYTAYRRETLKRAESLSMSGSLPRMNDLG